MSPLSGCKTFFADLFAGSRAWHKLQRKKREEIFERDNQKCVICGAEEGLNLAHIVSSGRKYEKYPSRNDWGWRYKGRELCPGCGSFSFYERKTREPRYRCKGCGMEFDEAVNAERAWTEEVWESRKKMASDLIEEKTRELEKYFDDENLITLCTDCHVGLDTRLEYGTTSEARLEEKKCIRRWLKERYGSHYRKELEKKYGKKWHRYKL